MSAWLVFQSRPFDLLTKRAIGIRESCPSFVVCPHCSSNVSRCHLGIRIDNSDSDYKCCYLATASDRHPDCSRAMDDQHRFSRTQYVTRNLMHRHGSSLLQVPQLWVTALSCAPLTLTFRILRTLKFTGTTNGNHVGLMSMILLRGRTFGSALR